LPVAIPVEVTTMQPELDNEVEDGSSQEADHGSREADLGSRRQTMAHRR